jgi:hypothetical protein
MKITREGLQGLIKESIRRRQSILLEFPNNPESRTYRKDDNDDEGHMAKKELFHMSQKAQQLHDILMDNEDLEPWVQAKITKAAAMMSSVFDHMMYQKHPGHVKE